MEYFYREIPDLISTSNASFVCTENGQQQPITRTRSMSALDATKNTDDLRPSVRCFRYVRITGFVVQLPKTSLTSHHTWSIAGTRWSTKNPDRYHTQTCSKEPNRARISYPEML
jgi:hypothetical protein